MTESTNPAVLGLVKNILEVERKAEVAYIADYQTYLESDEDTPLADAGPPGPLFVKSDESADALRAARCFIRGACRAWGSGEAWDLYTAREPVRHATSEAHDRLTNEKLDGRIDYKARQEPAMPLTPAEYARWHDLAYPAPVAEPAAEASSDTVEPATEVPETPATTPAAPPAPNILLPSV